MKNGNTKSVRERKAAARKKAELQKNLKYVAAVAIPVVLIALVIVVAFIGKNASSIDIDYGAGLDSNGMIAGVTASDYVELCDYSDIVFQEPEVAMEDEEWEEVLADLLEESGLEEVTDEYIAENYGEHASTLDEYKEYVSQLVQEENIKTLVLDYLVENSTVKSIPKKYYNAIEDCLDGQYKYEYSYYNNLYYQFLGYYNWNSYLDYYGMTKSEYKAMLASSATESAEQNLIMQAVFEQMGLTLTDEDVNTAIIEAGYAESAIDTAVENYGMEYWKQFAISYKVVSEIAATVRVN